MKFGIRRSSAGIRKRFQVLAPGASLRKRIGYSLAIVRLILVPVIFLAIYYLLEIGWIVDRIVSFDAPAATLAQQASITMLEARHAEHNYLLLYDPTSLQANRDSIQKIEQIMSAISDLQPTDEPMTQETLAALGRYNDRSTRSSSSRSNRRRINDLRARSRQSAQKRSLQNPRSTR
jgi:hypothetical protein